MEVVTIEKRTFSYVCERFTEFAKRIESLCSTHTQKVENWLTEGRRQMDKMVGERTDAH